jgi:hypothetical protein
MRVPSGGEHGMPEIVVMGSLLARAADLAASTESIARAEG